MFTVAAAGMSTAMSADLPGKDFQDGYVEAGGFRLHFRAAGPADGTVIVSLPGSAGLEMSRAKDQLARTFRIIEINPPGWGDDAGLTREMDQDEIGRLLGEAANRLVTGKYILLGTSMGGANALWLAQAFPQRVRAIVLEGSMAPTRDVDLYAPMIRRENIRKMLTNPPAGGAAYPAAPPDPTKPWATPDYVAKQMAQRMRMMQWVQADMGSDALFESIRRAKLPVLALLGDADPIIKPSVRTRYAQVLPNARFVLLAGGNHDLQNSRTDAFVQELVQFIGELK